MAAKTTEQQVPLYLKVWLTSRCRVELQVTGEFDSEAFQRMIAFLSLAGDVWGAPEKAEANTAQSEH
jgi:hypothetical protein